MSDTVKLLIEIPKKDYEWAKQIADTKNESVYFERQLIAISNGTPLDAVKAHALCTSRKDTDGDDPMIGIIWYNGLDGIVIKWKDHKEGDDAPYFKYESILSAASYTELQMVWMYLVLCFGNYGTSPRSGWIEDFDGYKKWFEELEKLMKPLA